MQTELHTFGGGVADSSLNPIVFVAIIVAITAVFVLPRKQIIVPILLTFFLIPLGQQFTAGGVHWFVSRVVILCAAGRIIMTRGQYESRFFPAGFSGMDKAFLGCIICQALAFMTLYNFRSQALTYEFGFLLDAFGGYCVVRNLTENEADGYRALKVLAFITVIVGLSMVREQLSMQNVFGLIGGAAVPEVREGKIRSQGVFQHALTAGTFGATMLPLFVLLWRNGRVKLLAWAGMFGCTIMTICSNSSTPLLAYAASVFGMMMWPLRKSMRTVRWGLVAGIAGLQMVMKAPVWFAIAHIDLTGGSSGYHRAELVDQFINHFGDWWLIGIKDSEASNWGPDMWDQQNQFVSTGEAGGILALTLLIVMICKAYAKLGNARKVVAGTERESVPWLLGAALFANLVAFFGVNYFDQIKVAWFLLLSMITAISASILEKKMPEVVVAPETSSPVYSDYLPVLQPESTLDWHELAQQSHDHFRRSELDSQGPLGA